MNSQLSQMNVDLNSQELCIRIKQAKRERLRVTLKSLKSEVALINKVIAQTQHDLSLLRERIEIVNNANISEMARLATVTYRSLSRMHSIIISIILYIVIHPYNHAELAQLAYELLRTIYQLHV